MGTDLKSTGMCLEAGRELQCTKQKTSPKKEQRVQCWQQADAKKIYSWGLRWKLGRGIVWATEDVQLNLILVLQDH